MTKEDLQKEFENETGITIPMVNTFEYSEWLEQKLIDQSQEPKQMKVSEELQYQNLTCLVNGFELTTYQKSLAKQEYDKLLSMKEREAVEVDKKIICRNCKSTAVYQEVGTFICGECNASW